MLLNDITADHATPDDIAQMRLQLARLFWRGVELADKADRDARDDEAVRGGNLCTASTEIKETTGNGTPS